MANYNCVPAAVTMDPCPAGMAPDIVIVTSSGVPETYTNEWGFIPIQDLMVGIALIICLLLGIGVGRMR